MPAHRRGPWDDSAGWDKLTEVYLPRLDGAGQPSSGFSAATYRADRDELWLLSDAPVGQLVGWSGLGKLGKTPLRPLGSLAGPYRLGRRDQRWRPPEPASSGAPSRRRIATTPGRGAVPAAADGQLEPSGTCLSCSKLPPFRSRRV